MYCTQLFSQYDICDKYSILFFLLILSNVWSKTALIIGVYNERAFRIKPFSAGWEEKGRKPNTRSAVHLFKPISYTNKEAVNYKPCGSTRFFFFFFVCLLRRCISLYQIIVVLKAHFLLTLFNAIIFLRFNFYLCFFSHHVEYLWLSFIL